MIQKKFNQIIKTQASTTTTSISSKANKNSGGKRLAVSIASSAKPSICEAVNSENKNENNHKSVALPSPLNLTVSTSVLMTEKFNQPSSPPAASGSSTSGSCSSLDDKPPSSSSLPKPIFSFSCSSLSSMLLFTSKSKSNYHNNIRKGG